MSEEPYIDEYLMHMAFTIDVIAAMFIFLNRKVMYSRNTDNFISVANFSH